MTEVIDKSDLRLERASKAIAFITEDDATVEYLRGEGLNAMQAPYGDFTEIDLDFARSIETEYAAIILDGYFDSLLRARGVEAALGFIVPKAVTIETGCLEESLGRLRVPARSELRS